MLAHLAATGDESPVAATFVVTMLAGEKQNVVGMLDTSQARTVLKQAAEHSEIVPGTALRSLFAMLRPNDLVFNYLVSGWLMGVACPVRRPGVERRCHPDYGQVRARDHQAGPGRMGRPRADPARRGHRLRQGHLRSYHVGGYTDHITAWRACYDTAHLVGGSDKEMTLIRSGHIQSVVYPPDSTRYDRWYGPPTPTDPDEWIETATVKHGSWWRPWTEWLIARSGPEKTARATLGNRQYPPLAPTPAPMCSNRAQIYTERALVSCGQQVPLMANSWPGAAPDDGNPSEDRNPYCVHALGRQTTPQRRS